MRSDWAFCVIGTGAASAGRGTNLGKDERHVLSLWSGRPGNDSLRAAADRVRVQQGLSDRFLSGLIRSGRWEERIRAALRDAGVPESLAALPHVESSFNPDARSYVGAAGLWQFTAGTGGPRSRFSAGWPI